MGVQDFSQVQYHKVLRNVCACGKPQAPGDSGGRNLRPAAASGLSVRSRGSSIRSGREQEEVWPSTEKLPVGYSHFPRVRIGRSRLSSLWRADENTCGHRFPGCDPQNFNLPWPPHESSAHRPCGIGLRHGVCMVAERPICSAIRWTCAQKTKPGRLIRPAIR